MIVGDCASSCKAMRLKVLHTVGLASFRQSQEANGPRHIILD